jgi:hypothetical protein
MSDALLLVAALLLIVTSAVHSVVGERRLLGPVLARREGILKSSLARFVLRFAWHITSVAWAVIALILLALVLDPPGPARPSPPSARSPPSPAAAAISAGRS